MCKQELATILAAADLYYRVWGQLNPLKNKFPLISYKVLEKLPRSGGNFVNKIWY